MIIIAPLALLGFLAVVMSACVFVCVCVCVCVYMCVVLCAFLCVCPYVVCLYVYARVCADHIRSPKV